MVKYIILTGKFRGKKTNLLRFNKTQYFLTDFKGTSSRGREYTIKIHESNVKKI